MDYHEYVHLLKNENNVKLLNSVIFKLDIRQILFMKKEYVMKLLQELLNNGEERAYNKILADVLKMKEQKNRSKVIISGQRK